MAGSLNRVMLIGRLTRDPELRYTPSGTAVCNLGLATNRYGKDAGGENKEFTDFHDVVVWNQGNRKLAELCGQYLQKGRLVYIEGRLQTRSWDDQTSGQKRHKTEINASDIQFIDSRQDGGGGSLPAYAAAPSGAGGGNAPAGAATGGISAPSGNAEPVGGDIDPDDIPF